MTKKNSRCLLAQLGCRAILILGVLFGGTSVSDAQPFGFGGRGFGGRGGGPNGSLLFLSWSSEVHEELDMSKDQVEMLAALRLDLLTQRRGDAEQQTQGSEIGDKLLSAVLSEQQAKRFEELRLQFEGLRAFDRPAVRTALGVTDEQLERIRELRDDRSTEATTDQQLQEVLTDEQLGNWTAMIGEKASFLERFSRRGRFRGRRNRGGPFPGNDGDRGERPQRPQRPE